jgi:hypothetical protein
MKKIITLLATSVLLLACKGNMYGDKNNHKEKLHNKGVAIEKHAPRHMDNVTRDVANRASSASLKK